MKKDARFLKALRSEPVDRPPVWFMRQAGRYLPEYQALRARYSLKEMFSTPELALQATLQPIHRFSLDAAILFSDILVIAEALGLSVDFAKIGGPRVFPLVKSSKDVENMQGKPVESALFYVKETIAQLLPELNIPLIGFCGGPVTVASYLVEEQGTEKLRATKKWMYSDPVSFHALLEKITDKTVDYLKMQEEAGVDAIQIFDSWAGLLPPSLFSAFVLPYLERLIKAVSLPVIVFCRGSCTYAKELAALSPTAISIDGQREMCEVRKEVPEGIALQGNLDPDLLQAPLPIVEEETRRLLKSMQGTRGFIVNLAHGVLPETPVEAVERLVRTVTS